MKTEEVELVIKSMGQGTVSLKPTVLYLDENGKYKPHEPEPVLIVVRELGIKSWLEGKDDRRPVLRKPCSARFSRHD